MPDRIWVPAAAALALALAFAGALLVRAGGDVSLLVHAGAPCTTRRAAPPLPSCDATIRFVDETGPTAGSGARPSLTVQDADQAFDGQFFYRLGVAPWSTDGRVAGVQHDLPALRNARWGYGALAWIASAGDPDLVPWALVGLNVAAVTAIGALGGALARGARHHAAWGLLFVLWPGFAYSLSLDTSELVASALVLAGLVALQGRRWVPAAALLTAAVLTRDTTAVVPFAVLLVGLSTLFPAPGGDAEPRTASRAQPGMAAAGGLPLVAFATWQLVLRARFGALPLTSSGDNNLSLPLGGLVDQLGAVVVPSSSAEALRLVSIVGLVALVGATGWLVWRDRRAGIDPERVAWLGAVAVVLLLNAYLWSGATAFMRAATEAGLLSILLVLRLAPRRLLRLTGAGLGGLWLITAVAQLTKLG